MCRVTPPHVGDLTEVEFNHKVVTALKEEGGSKDIMLLKVRYGESQKLEWLRLKKAMKTTFLQKGLEPGQPFLLGEQKNIQRFYVIVDHKAQTSLSFDELFRADFIFSVNYHESLNSFYTFIQTTVSNRDVGRARGCPRVPELRARFLLADI